MANLIVRNVDEKSSRRSKRALDAAASAPRRNIEKFSPRLC